MKQLSTAEVPDRVHLEELDFFGNPSAVLVAAAGGSRSTTPGRRSSIRGAATPENLSRLVPVPFTAKELVTLLLGSAPLLDGIPVSATPERGQVRLRLERGEVTEDLWIGAHSAVERAVRRVAGGAGPGSWEVEFSGHQERSGAWFPGVVVLHSAPTQVEVHLAWSEVEVNREPDPQLFEPLAPRGARVVELGDGTP